MTQNIILKLILIDIFPSVEEIEHNSNNEEVSIIFQGLNIFHNLKDLLTSKKVIYINKPIPKNNSLILSLVQSINILAIGLLTIKSGKQWVTFSYQNKNKTMSPNLVKNLINCIKINISCEIIFNNMDYYNNINVYNINKTFRNNYSKETKKIIIQNKYSKNPNKKKYNSKSINKNNSSQEKYIINGYTFNGRNTFNFTMRNKNLILKSKKENLLKSISSFSTLSGDTKKFYLNSSLSLSNNKYIRNSTYEEQNKMYSTIRQKFSDYNKNNYSLLEQSCNEFEIEPKIEVKEELNLLKKNKTIYELKHETFQKKQKSCNTLKIMNNKSNIKHKRNNNNQIELIKLKKNDSIKKISINNKNSNIVNKVHTFQRKKSNNNFDYDKNNNNYYFSIDRNNLYNMSSTSLNSYFKKNSLETSINNYDNNDITEKKSWNNINNLNFNKITNSFVFNSNKQLNSNLSDNNLYERNQTIENINNLSLENNNFHKLKEDFILLYNNEYVKNIKDDLIKLEIELFVEKMEELSKEYHIQISDKLLEYHIQKNKFNQYLSKFLQINKLYNKLQIIKVNYEIKRKRKNNNNKIFIKQNKDFFDTNHNEIKIYKILWKNKNNLPNEAENKVKLKELLNLILNKEYIKENNIINDNKNSNKINKILERNKTFDGQYILKPNIAQKNEKNKSNFGHLNLINSYSCDISNDNKPDIYNKNNSRFKSHIFSPFIRINNFKPKIIDNKSNFYNKFN